MTAALFPEVPDRSAAAARCRLALVLSLAAHLAVLVPLALDAPRLDAESGAAAGITVRLEAPEKPFVPETEAAPAAAVRGEGIRGASARTREHVQRRPAESFALTQAPDPTYYSARDLDVYPRPAQPLDFGRFPAGTAALRFSLLIDASGFVNEVAPVDAEGRGRLYDELRAALAAARFVPGFKDGRAVRSRVLLSIGPDPADGGGR